MTHKGLYGAGGGSAKSSSSFTSEGGNGQRGVVRIIYPTPAGDSDTTTIIDRGLPVSSTTVDTPTPPPILEFLGGINQGQNQSSTQSVSITSLSTPAASSYALIVAMGAENGAYTALTDADGNSYTRHVMVNNDEFATIFGMDAEVTSMPSSLTFSNGGERIAFGVYALSNATSLTPQDTASLGANLASPHNLTLTTQAGDVCVAALGHIDTNGGDVTVAADAKDWDFNLGSCSGRGGSTVATGTSTTIQLTSTSTSANGASVAAAWR